MSSFEDNTFAATDTTDTNTAIIHILHKVGGIYKHLRFLTSEFHFLLKNLRQIIYRTTYVFVALRKLELQTPFTKTFLDTFSKIHTW